jgi:phage terminase Nu1 subunit (DNA packaging protein)
LAVLGRRKLTEQPFLMDQKQTAAFAGVTEGVVRGWAAEGLPFVRAGRGGKKNFDRRDVIRFIERKKETAV